MPHCRLWSATDWRFAALYSRAALVRVKGRAKSELAGSSAWARGAFAPRGTTTRPGREDLAGGQGRRRPRCAAGVRLVLTPEKYLRRQRRDRRVEVLS